jgi:hypothetical protein
LDPPPTAAVRRWCRAAAPGDARAPADVAPLLVVETFAVTLAVIAAVWAGWILLWLIEQRW